MSFKINSLNKGLIFHAPLNSKSEKVGDELLTNPNFTSYSGESFTGWTSRDTDNVVTYSHQNNFNQNITDCVRIYYDSNANIGWYQRIYQYINADLEIGKSYRVRVWARANKIIPAIMRISSLNSANIQLNLDSTLSTEWIKYERTFTCTSTTDLTFWLGASGVELPVAGDWFEFAQASIKELKTADITPNANHGIVYGATQNDDYMEFDGSSDIIISNSPIDIVNTLTLSCWAKSFEIQTNAYGRFIGVDSRWILYLNRNNNKFSFYGSGVDNSFNNSPPLNDNEWHHLAITYNGNGIIGYVDNNWVGTLEKTGSLQSTVGIDFTVGNRISLDRELNGNIKDIRIYNRALSEQEIKQLYNLQGRQNNIQTGNLYKNLILDMPLTSKYNTNDLTPNNNNGVNNGAVIRNHGCYFDGSNDRISLSSNLISMPQSYSVWIKVSSTISDSTRVGNVIGNYPESNCVNFEIHQNGKPRLYWNSGEKDWIVDYDVRTNEWIHLVFVRDVDIDYRYLYINGELYSSQIGSYTSISSLSNWTIGDDRRYGDSPGIPFNGVIKNLKLYNRALSESEIKQLYLKELNQ